MENIYIDIAKSTQVASVAVFNKDGKILMGKRKDSGKWTLPGGHFENGETKEQAAKRELKEETNIDAGKLQYLVSEDVNTPDAGDITVSAFKTIYDGPTSVVSDPDEEVERWRWINVENGLPEEIVNNLHASKNVTLQHLGLQKVEKADLFLDLEKARTFHKYTRRTGTPGKYRYFYTGELATGEKHEHSKKDHVRRLLIALATKYKNQKIPNHYYGDIAKEVGVDEAFVKLQASQVRAQIKRNAGESLIVERHARTEVLHHIKHTDYDTAEIQREKRDVLGERFKNWDGTPRGDAQGATEDIEEEEVETPETPTPTPTPRTTRTRRPQNLGEDLGTYGRRRRRSTSTRERIEDVNLKVLQREMPVDLLGKLEGADYDMTQKILASQMILNQYPSTLNIKMRAWDTPLTDEQKEEEIKAYRKGYELLVESVKENLETNASEAIYPFMGAVQNIFYEKGNFRRHAEAALNTRTKFYNGAFRGFANNKIYSYNLRKEYSKFTKAFQEKHDLTSMMIIDSFPEKKVKFNFHAGEFIGGKSVKKIFNADSTGISRRQQILEDRVERVGPDHGMGSLDSQETYLMDTVGIRGTQWGSALGSSERRFHTEHLANAFKDLADVLGVDDSVIAWKGRIGVSVASRGNRNAAAHYEPSTKIINISRDQGAGSLAHEWGHFFDNVGFNVAQGSSVRGYLSGIDSSHYSLSNEHRRVGVAMDALKKSDGWKSYSERLSVKGYHSFQAKRYWTSNVEKFARAFEQYVAKKLEKQGRKNSYLVTPVRSERGGDSWGQHWPTEEETSSMTEHFEELFNAAKETELIYKALQILMGEESIENLYIQKGPFADAFLANHPKAAKFMMQKVGTRGGNIVGQTKSGKPIYEHTSHLYKVGTGEEGFARKFKKMDYTHEDHEDAAKHHESIGNKDEANLHRTYGMKGGFQRKFDQHFVGANTPTIQNSEKLYIDIIKATGTGGKQFKYIRKYRRGNRWVYVYRDPSHTRGHQVSEAAAEKLRQLAELGHPGAQAEKLPSEKLDALRKLADLGHVQAKEHLHSLGIDRISERIEETILPRHQWESGKSDHIDKKLDANTIAQIKIWIKETVNENVFQYLGGHRSSQFFQKLQSAGVNIDSIMSYVDGSSLRELLTGLDNGLQEVDNAHASLDISSSQNTDVRNAGGYGNYAYQRTIKMLELSQSSELVAGRLPHGYSEAHSRGGEMPSTKGMQEAVIRRQREREDEERRERAEREERLRREAAEMEGSMAHHIGSLLGRGSEMSADQMREINNAFTNIFGRELTKEDWPWNFDEHGVRVQVDRVSSGGSMVSFNLSAYDRDGRAITSGWTRTFSTDSNGKPNLYNNYLEVNASARNADVPISQLINFGSFDMMKNLAPETGSVTVSAALTVGGYRWATMGFKFKGTTQANEYRHNFKAFLMGKGIHLTDEELEYFKEPAHFAAFHDGKLYEHETGSALNLKPKQIETRSLSGVAGKHPLTDAEISSGKSSRMMVHLGKKFLLGKSWSGRIKTSEMNDRNEIYNYMKKVGELKTKAWKVFSQPYKAMIEAVHAGSRTGPIPDSGRFATGTGGTLAPRRTRRSTAVRRPHRFRNWSAPQQRDWFEANRSNMSAISSRSALDIVRQSESNHASRSNRLVELAEHLGVSIPDGLREGTTDQAQFQQWVADHIRPRFTTHLLTRDEAIANANATGITAYQGENGYRGIINDANAMRRHLTDSLRRRERIDRERGAA